MRERQEYARRLEQRQGELQVREQRHLRLGNWRLVAAVCLAAALFGAFKYEVWSPWWMALPALAFVWVGTRMQKAEEDRAHLRRAVSYYVRALARVDGDWAGKGESGARFLDEHHLYANDLDLFGTGSLFELLCNARTRVGEATLAGWLCGPAAGEVVRARQAAVEELAPRLDLREDLAVLGETARGGLHAEALAQWGDGPVVLEVTAFRAVAWVLSVLGAVAVLAFVTYMISVLGLLPMSEPVRSVLRIYFLLMAMGLWGVLRHFRQRTDRVLHEAEAASHDLALLAGVLGRLEADRFAAPRLAELRATLDVEGAPPSRRMAQLNRLMELADSRDHQLMRLIGPALLWDLHLAYAMEDWRRKSGSHMRQWLEAVGEMEALSSLAGYRYENPESVYPELVEGASCFEGEALCHPLLARGGAVANDVRLGDQLRVMVVSGSNMSGKSTLLRTVGVSAVLAQAGSPVRARRLRMTPLCVGASIRLQDSLQAGESRFYAEILRLRQIVEAAGGGGTVLFLIDEMLHGTNSHDRRIGAEAIVRGLVKRGAMGFVTTHDLALSEIAGEMGMNVHFEDHLEDGRMRFDYRMRPGVVQKSNAIALMRSVGLEV